MSRALLVLLVGSAISTSLVERVQAQAPAGGAAVTATVTVPAAGVPANLNQLMRGALYPAANIVFAAQDQDPADIPRAKDPNMATDPLTSVFGRWEAVENSALTLAELANILTLPRKCANGVDAPVKSADWAKFVQELRDAGMAAYAGAQAKSVDKMSDVSGVMATACAHCHGKYRDRRKPEDRCK